MASVKTAISLEESLFNQVEVLAKEMKLPRSRLFTLAIEEFLHRRRNKELLESLNAAYGDEPEAEDQAWEKWALNQQRQLLEHDPW